MTAYQPGIPTGTVFLNQDYLNIQNNFQQLDTIYGKDHIPYSQVSNSGYHTLVHMVAQSAIPPIAVAGTGELYTFSTNDGVNTDIALYYQTGGGRQIKMTGNFVPSANNNGFSMLPGGMILQWGRVTGKSGNWPLTPQTLNFATNNMNFGNNCFAVFTTFIGPTSSTSGDICINSQSSSNFVWQFTGGSSNPSFDGFFWWAVGN